VDLGKQAVQKKHHQQEREQEPEEKWEMPEAEPVQG